jgi:hypothetical protein
VAADDHCVLVLVLVGAQHITRLAQLLQAIGFVLSYVHMPTLVHFTRIHMHASMPCTKDPQPPPLVLMLTLFVLSYSLDRCWLPV